MMKALKSFSGKPLLWVVILVIPLFFINIKDTHNWGDDFALYLHQANNITEGISPQYTGLIYNEDNPIMISAVSPGFSLLLAPVYYFFGNNIKSFNYLMTLFLALSALIVFLFISGRSGSKIALLVVLFIIYHRWTLEFKTNILSDIPFFLLIYLVLYLYDLQKGNFSWPQLILLSFLTGFMLSFRAISIVLIIALAWDDFYRHVIVLKNSVRKIGKTFLVITVFTILSIGIYLLIDKLAFPDPETTGGYLQHFRNHDIVEVIAKNPSYYFGYLSSFFRLYHTGPVLQFITLWTVMLFFMIGLIVKIKRFMETMDWFFLGFLFVILIYPATPGFRYLLPLVPLMLLYVYYGLSFIAEKIIPAKAKQIVSFYYVFLVVLLYPGFFHVLENRQSEIPGPYTDNARDVFEVIRQTTPEESRFVFRKPRALSLFTGRDALANNLQQRDAEKMDSIYAAKKIDYLLINTQELPDSALLAYLDRFAPRYDTVYSNESFTLFHRK